MSGTISLENLKRTLSRSLMVAGILSIGYCPTAAAQSGAPSRVPDAAILFENVRIFDGRNAALSASSHVLVRGNAIECISAAPIDVRGNADVQVIAAGGRVLMPGLIDAHWHAFMAATPQAVLMSAEPSYLHLLAARHS
jgi:imidazolonepropionase-like amidohydrolase